MVYLLPSQAGLQDQTYVSNLGVVVPHLDRATLVLSRFRSPPRVGEAEAGRPFLRLLDFAIHQPPPQLAGEPLYFEGEAASSTSPESCTWAHTPAHVP